MIEYRNQQYRSHKLNNERHRINIDHTQNRYCVNYYPMNIILTHLSHVHRDLRVIIKNSRHVHANLCETKIPIYFPPKTV